MTSDVPEAAPTTMDDLRRSFSGPAPRMVDSPDSSAVYAMAETKRIIDANGGFKIPTYPAPMTQSELQDRTHE